MLSVWYDVKDKEGVGLSIDYHLGDRLIGQAINSIQSIQADGHELEYILQRFPSILVPVMMLSGTANPTRSNTFAHDRVVKWYGDQAKFIIGNW